MSLTIVLSDVVLTTRRKGKSDPFLKLTEGAVDIGRTVPQCAAEGEPLRVPKFTAYGAWASGLVLELWERDFANPDALVGVLQLGTILSSGDAGQVQAAPLLAADGVEAGTATFGYELLQAEASSAETMEPALLNAIVSSFEMEGEAPTGGAKAAYDGAGTLHFLSGNRYSGELKGSMMAGRGEYAWEAEQVQYAGDFARNALDGHGAYAWKDGSKYEGEVKAGLRHGRGVFRSADGAREYDGEWEAGKRHGVGKLTYDAEGKEFYEGQWSLDLKAGQGVMRYASGNEYGGAWHEDVKCGQGTMLWADLRERYVGEWRGGRQHGTGEHTWLRLQLQSSPYQMRERYAGEWCEGERCAQLAQRKRRYPQCHSAHSSLPRPPAARPSRRLAASRTRGRARCAAQGPRGMEGCGAAVRPGRSRRFLRLPTCAGTGRAPSSTRTARGTKVSG